MRASPVSLTSPSLVTPCQAVESLSELSSVLARVGVLRFQSDPGRWLQWRHVRRLRRTAPFQRIVQAGGSNAKEELMTSPWSAHSWAHGRFTHSSPHLSPPGQPFTEPSRSSFSDGRVDCIERLVCAEGLNDERCADSTAHSSLDRIPRLY